MFPFCIPFSVGVTATRSAQYFTQAAIVTLYAEKVKDRSSGEGDPFLSSKSFDIRFGNWPPITLLVVRTAPPTVTVT